jgi:outer membrane receptor protein involved in Fe transport
VGPFTSTPIRQVLPEYTKLNLRIGARFNGWNASLYANNVTDERGMINGGLGYIQPNTYVYITPRLVGVNISKTF